MDLEQARFNMIEQQIRPWGMHNQKVLNTLAIIKREKFVRHDFHDLAFTDTELPLLKGQAMLSPKIEARVLQALDLHSHEQVLEIGTGSGYMAALLSHHAQHVTTIEIFSELTEFAHQNLSKSGIANINIILGNGALGWTGNYDAICISGSLPTLPPILLNHLNIGGRLVAFIGNAPLIKAQLIKRTTTNDYIYTNLFETSVSPLINAPQPSRFIF